MSITFSSINCSEVTSPFNVKTHFVVELYVSLLNLIPTKFQLFRFNLLLVLFLTIVSP